MHHQAGRARDDPGVLDANPRANPDANPRAAVMPCGHRMTEAARVPMPKSVFDLAKCARCDHVYLCVDGRVVKRIFYV